MNDAERLLKSIPEWSLIPKKSTFVLKSVRHKSTNVWNLLKYV